MEKWRENYDNWKTREPGPHYCKRCDLRIADYDGLICEVCAKELSDDDKVFIEDRYGNFVERYVCTQCGVIVDPDDWCSEHRACWDCCGCE